MIRMVLLPFRCLACIASMRLSRVLVVVFCTLILVPFFIHYLSEVEKEAHRSHSGQTNNDLIEEYSESKYGDLKYRIHEMHQIKASVSNNLRSLESKRLKLQNEMSSYHQKIDQLKMEMVKQQTELNKLKISVQQAQLSNLEALQHNSPELAPPLSILASSLPAFREKVTKTLSCRRMHNCFDYSRCALTSGFPVYLYDPEEYFLEWKIPTYLKTLIRQTVSYNAHLTTVPENACIYLVLIGESRFANISLLSSLPYWGGDGRNHVILNLSQRQLHDFGSISPSRGTGKAILVQSGWNEVNFRAHHDLIAFPFVGPPGGETWKEVPYMLPARRKHLLSFQGCVPQTNHSRNDELTSYRIKFIHEHLTLATTDEFFMDFECADSKDEAQEIDVREWLLCKTEKERGAILKESTFALIPSPIDTTYVSTPVFLVRLYESLKYGAIPLILGADQIELPFGEVIDWQKVVVSIPLARITECHWLLRSIPDNDLLFFRRQGRLLYDKYFATGQTMLDTTLAVIRNRLSLPPLPVTDEPAISVFPHNVTPLKTDPVVSEIEPEENLGPLEPRYNSLEFKRNYSVIRTQNYELWNQWADPFHLYPHLPFDILLPSDAKFIGSEKGFRAINKGAGGAGKEFCESLGGNVQKEQFTMVILTYERDQVLMNSLSRLHGIPYLNKVVVVWNSPSPPVADLRWPEIGVPVHVVKTKKNSLNNRFLPWDVIETEAVLSVDDDAHLRHDEIIFAFRVWREQRDQIVGFPGRYHALDLNHGGWLYNSNYSCELSMVLTGAAFIHKYYLYMYTHYLPQAVRDMVDEFMNCEDIAINFLVSHLTRKPPVKITSRWTFRCPGCPVSLSEDETHFNERHRCINFFTKVFGYTPLLYTQFRADSILFKTRIPHDKQKCFKFI